MTNSVAPGLALTTLSWTLCWQHDHLFRKLFNGIESMYAVHKFLPSYQLLLLVFHNIGMGSLWGSQGLAGQLETSADLHLAIVVLAFLGKHLQI